MYTSQSLDRPHVIHIPTYLYIIIITIHICQELRFLVDLKLESKA